MVVLRGKERFLKGACYNRVVFLNLVLSVQKKEIKRRKRTTVFTTSPVHSSVKLKSLDVHIFLPIQLQPHDRQVRKEDERLQRTYLYILYLPARNTLACLASADASKHVASSTLQQLYIKVCKTMQMVMRCDRLHCNHNARRLRSRPFIFYMCSSDLPAVPPVILSGFHKDFAEK